MRVPLAQQMRPNTLDDVFGQRHLLGEGKMFRTVLERGAVPNMIFFGPSGTGKTTVAGIIAKNSNMQLYRLNGTSASTSDIKEAIASVNTLAGYKGVLLYLDEIQYFNKKQQQSLLETIESGSVTLIASTTENPYFYIYGALLSRCTVFEFKQLEPMDVKKAIERALSIVEKDEGVSYDVSDDVLDFIAKRSGGDVRKALNAVDLLVAAAEEKKGVKTFSKDDAEQVVSYSSSRYDRQDDVHYDLLSALQKSVRGSDPDAALHYLARLLDAGDLISPCRRLLVMASEDIGLAYPQAVAVVKACVDAAHQLGLPEAIMPLSQAAVLLATSPKSNSANAAYSRALSDIHAGEFSDVPDHLKPGSYSGAKNLGRGQGYKYAHAYEDSYVSQQYLPESIKDAKYYEYGDNKAEQAAKAYWDRIKTKEPE